MKNLFSLLALCACISCFAQINFEPGYFISANGTKTECLIKNVAWKNNPVSFEYRLSENSPVETGGIDQVDEFEVASYKFIKYTVDIDRSSSDISQMSTVRKPEYKSETLFLKVLVEGNPTLYKYEDGNLVRFFFSNPTNVAVQLIYKPYRSDASIYYNNEFRGQLYAAMKDKYSEKEFKTLKYHQEKLIKLFLQYNGNETETVNYSESQNKTEFNLKITPGFTLNSLNVKQFSIDFGGNSHESTKAGFRLGLEAELVFPFNNKKWSVFADPNFQIHSDSYNETIYPGELFETRRIWQTDYSFVEIPVGIRHYMYLKGNNKLFINLAYIYSFPVGKDDMSVSTEGYFNYTLNAKISNSTGFAAGAGFATGRISLEARYNFKREINNKYLLWEGKFSSFNLVAGYRFL